MTLSRSRPFYLYDYLIIGYCALMAALIVIFGEPLGQHFAELFFYVASLALAWTIAATIDERSSRLAAIIRTAYPAVLFTFFYRMTGGLMFLFFDSFNDSQLFDFETRVIGMELTLLIDSFNVQPWLTELFSFCYFCYYLIIPAFVIYTLLRSDYETLKRGLTACCIMFFSSYILFSLYPLEGPRWFLADRYLYPLDGYLFFGLVKYIIDNAAVHGGAMPSSHIGVALVILVYTLRSYRTLGLWLLPIVIGLGIGTVWGRFHYLSDVVVGIILAWLAIALTDRYYARFMPLPMQSTLSPETPADHAARTF